MLIATGLNIAGVIVGLSESGIDGMMLAGRTRRTGRQGGHEGGTTAEAWTPDGPRSGRILAVLIPFSHKHCLGGDSRYNAIHQRASPPTLNTASGSGWKA
jgi:hypothetical protein